MRASDGNTDLYVARWCLDRLNQQDLRNPARKAGFKKSRTQKLREGKVSEKQDLRNPARKNLEKGKFQKTVGLLSRFAD